MSRSRSCAATRPNTLPATHSSPVRRVLAPDRLLRPQPVELLFARVHEAPLAGLSAAEAEGHAVCVLALLRAIRPADARNANSKPRSLNASTPTPTPTFHQPAQAGHGVRAALLLAEIGDVRSRFPDRSPWPPWPASPQ